MLRWGCHHIWRIHLNHISSFRGLVLRFLLGIHHVMGGGWWALIVTLGVLRNDIDRLIVIHLWNLLISGRLCRYGADVITIRWGRHQLLTIDLLVDSDIGHLLIVLCLLHRGWSGAHSILGLWNLLGLRWHHNVRGCALSDTYDYSRLVNEGCLIAFKSGRSICRWRPHHVMMLLWVQVPHSFSLIDYVLPLHVWHGRTKNWLASGLLIMVNNHLMHHLVNTLGQIGWAKNLTRHFLFYN